MRNLRSHIVVAPAVERSVELTLMVLAGGIALYDLLLVAVSV